MPRTRRIFGPLTYATLAAGVLACGYSASVIYLPRVGSWMEYRKAVALLGSDDPGARALAVHTLWDRSIDLAPGHFLAMLGDRRPGVRRDGIAALAILSNDPAGLVPALIALTDDGDVGVRVDATTNLGRLALARWARASAASDSPSASLKAAVTSALRARLADPAPEVRSAAAEAIAMGGPDDESADRLRSALVDSDRGVRLAAIKALFAIRRKDDPEANRALVALVIDPRPQVDRALCVATLAKASDDANRQAALGLAGLIGSDDDAIRVDALECLKRLGRRATPAVPALEAILAGEPTQDRSHAADVILAIVPEWSPKAQALRLAIIGDPTMPFDQRAAAVESLRLVPGPPRLPEAAAILIGQLSDPSQFRRAQALELLATVLRDIPAPNPSAASPLKP